MNFSEISNDEMPRNHRSNDLKSRVANTELQLKYLACAHIDLKNELAVLHQMVIVCVRNDWNEKSSFIAYLIRFNVYSTRAC